MQTFIFHKSCKQIDAVDFRKYKCSVNCTATRYNATAQSVLANATATDKESIEEMVRQVEWDLDKVLGAFERSKHHCLMVMVTAI